MHEVAKDGNSEKGSWVVPVVRSQSNASKDFVKAPDPITGELKPVVHEQGTFVFRLAGRERQQSASYYTPEVLTRFTVSQALVELIGPDEVKEGSVEWEGREVPRKMTAREILDLTVCEPALGSGAFAIEAVRQLAAAYLRRKQEETGERIDPDAYAAELQKVKTYIALHNVYGVDLNGTAVELAEISLWLDTMGKGLQAPWFGLHLKRGNSLIGARRAVYRRDQLAKKAWLTAVPTDVPLTPSDADRAAGRSSSLGDVSGRIHHFLLPAAGWGSAVEAKEAKELAPKAQPRLKAWRKTVLVTPSKKQADELVNLGHRVEALWDLAHQRLRIAEDQIRRSIDVWGADALPVGGAGARGRLAEAHQASTSPRDTLTGRHAGAVEADAATCAAAHAAAYHGSRGHVHDADTVALAGTHRSAGPSDAVCVQCLVDRGAVPRSCSTCTGTVRLAEPDAHYVLAVFGACPARLAVDPRLMPRCASFPTRVVVVRLPECACSIGGRDAAVCVVADHDRIAHAPDALASCFLVRTRWLLQRGCTGCACLAPCRDSPSRVGRRARRPHSLVGMAIVRCASP